MTKMELEFSESTQKPTNESILRAGIVTAVLNDVSADEINGELNQMTSDDREVARRIATNAKQLLALIDAA